jgi:hypothetical protein
MRPEDEGMNMRACCLIFVATLVLVALIAGGGYAHWRYPSPLGCSVGLVRPQKFKIDVTDFWAPHVSAAVRTPSERTPSERPPSERPSVRASERPSVRASERPPSERPPSALHPPPSALRPRHSSSEPSLSRCTRCSSCSQ